jgi:hypothetical protein
MDYGIGMFLAGLVSGAGIGWYAALLHVRAAYGDPQDLMRGLMLYKGLLYKAGLSVDGDPGGAGFFMQLCKPSRPRIG